MTKPVCVVLPVATRPEMFNANALTVPDVVLPTRKPLELIDTLLVVVPIFNDVWLRTAFDIVLPTFSCVVVALTFAPTFQATEAFAVPVMLILPEAIVAVVVIAVCEICVLTVVLPILKIKFVLSNVNPATPPLATLFEPKETYVFGNFAALLSM